MYGTISGPQSFHKISTCEVFSDSLGNRMTLCLWTLRVFETRSGLIVSAVRVLLQSRLKQTTPIRSYIRIFLSKPSNTLINTEYTLILSKCLAPYHSVLHNMTVVMRIVHKLELFSRIFPWRSPTVSEQKKTPTNIADSVNRTFSALSPAVCL